MPDAQSRTGARVKADQCNFRHGKV
ncbi:hypothetical protein I306_02033 [Cryptococcus gattii EJB2]|uniref:Uncharacterized protein n=1 Tax=Cryptococcus gattii EJB2 TaxID=1296103 RepID=A0ABR5BZ32_9TREE|nr:hypothetical protein I306_02033 [Cryptococcus gattii EJB2]